MPSLRDIRMLLRYSAWADATRLYDALEALPSEVVSQPRAGRPAGLISTLAHVYVVDRIWRGHLEDRSHGFKTRNVEQLPKLAELRQFQAEKNRWYVNYVDMQAEESLAHVVDFKFVDGGSGSLSRGDILIHVSNHKTYHRGYVADMLYESGLKPPTMDLPVFLRDAPPGL